MYFGTKVTDGAGPVYRSYFLYIVSKISRKECSFEDREVRENAGGFQEKSFDSDPDRTRL